MTLTKGKHAGDVEITVRLTRREADELLRGPDSGRGEGWASRAWERHNAEQKVRDAIDAASRP